MLSRSAAKRFPLLLAFMLVLVGHVTDVYAQQVTVEGQVVDDETGEPLPGATVVVEGTTLGASTDQEGEFTLTVPNPNVTLVVSYVGFLTDTVPLNGQTDVVIRLREDVALLEEVIVVGYGTQRRADVTGSVASVSPERLEDVPNTSFVQALQGALPGVTVGQTEGGAESELNLLVRGRNSITASNRPLVVVDGIPYEGTLSEINQNDVASIEVLKDASAAAIYGARGSNGVILVTTKKGAVGRPRVSYDAYAGVQNISNLPRMMTGPEFAAFKCQRLNDGVACSQDEIAASLTASEAAVFENGTWTDWVDLATRQGTQQQHNLSFSGGTEQTRYYIAGSLLDVEGVALNDAFERYTLRVNLDQTMNSWLQMGTSTHLSYTDRSGLSASFGDAFQMNPLTTPFEENGEQTIDPWPEDPFWDNPLQGLNTIDDHVNRRVLSSNFVEVDLPFVDNLSYRLNAGIDFAHTDAGRYYGRNTGRGLAVLGEARVENTNRFDWTLENILRYQEDFGKHLIDVTALYSAQKSRLEENIITAQGFPNDVLTYHDYRVASLITPAEPDIPDERIVSQMGRVNYSYDSRYLLTLTARRDGYSGFGANYKYGVFPSIALGWNVAREAFWPVPRTVNNLKLRVSYGQNGNQAISPYRTLARLREESYLDGTATAPGFVPNTLGNPNLRWETTNSLNGGLDFGLFEDRVTGTLDAYVSRTHDLLLNRTISPVHGIDQITENIGKVKNHGLELMLSSVNVDARDFTWTSNFNIAGNRNEIVSLYGMLDSTGREIDDLANGWFIGHPIDVNYGYRFGGIWQLGQEEEAAAFGREPGDVRVVDTDGDGQITPADRQIQGRLDPRYTAGFGNTIRYKNVSLNLFFHAVQGVYRPNPLMGSNLVHADVRLNTMYHDYWSPDNPTNDYPANRETANNVNSVSFYEDASFIRLKDVTVAYNLPQRFVQRVGVQSLRLYVNARNLWTITEWSGLDPELTNSNQRSVPLEKVFIGGINLSF